MSPCQWHSGTRRIRRLDRSANRQGPGRTAGKVTCKVSPAASAVLPSWPFLPTGEFFMLPPPRMRRSRHRSRGQSLAEFALVFPILMLIIGGIIQLGIFFWGQNTLNQVVRDTGRWAATQQGDCVTGPGQAALTTSITTTATSVATNSSLLRPLTGVTVTWTGATCPPTSNQQEAWVHIKLVSSVPIFFPFVPGGGDISSETQFRMEPKAP
jgi:hypothetical protein